MENIELKTADMLFIRSLIGRVYAILAAQHGNPLEFIAIEREKTKEIIRTAPTLNREITDADVVSAESKADQFFSQFHLNS